VIFFFQNDKITNIKLTSMSPVHINSKRGIKTRETRLGLFGRVPSSACDFYSS